MTETTEAELGDGIRWGRVIVGGLIIELVLAVITGLFYGLDRVEDLARWVIPATIVAGLLGGAWTGRGVSRPVLHGALAGVAAIVLYVILAVVGLMAAPDQVTTEALVTPVNLATHAVKVIAGAAGAWLVARRT